MNFNAELWNELQPSESVIRGLKARLSFCDQTILCTPANKCGCEKKAKQNGTKNGSRNSNG